MFCTKCGNEIKSHHRFCIKCGDPVPIQNNSDAVRHAEPVATTRLQTPQQYHPPRPTTAVFTQNPSQTASAPEAICNAPVTGINEKANKTRKILTLIQLGMLILQTIFIFCKIVKINVTMFSGMIDSDMLAKIAGDYFDGKTSFSLFDMFIELGWPIGAPFIFLTVVLMLSPIAFVSLYLLPPNSKRINTRSASEIWL